MNATMRVASLFLAAALLGYGQAPASTETSAQEIREFAYSVFRAMRTANAEELRAYTAGPASTQVAQKLASYRTGDAEAPMSEAQPVWSIISVDMESPRRATLQARLTRTGSLVFNLGTENRAIWLLIKTPNGWRIASAN